MSPDDNSKMDNRGTTGVKPTPKTRPKSRASTANEETAIEIRSRFRNYTANPSTDRDARIQGLAMLRAILHDPKGEIEKSIRDWGFQHTVAKRTTYVQMMLAGEKSGYDKAFKELTKGKEGKDVAFIIATWCMLGGDAASTCGEDKNGQKRTRSNWGKKMSSELRLLGKTAHLEFDLCKPYVTGKLHKQSYNYDEASMNLWHWNKHLLNPGTEGNAKRAANFSHDNLDAAKRRKTTAPTPQIQQETDFPTPNEAQLKTVGEGATTTREDDLGTTTDLFAKLSREQLEVMNRVLKSKIDSLEKQSALRLGWVNEWSTKANTLQDIVDKAANHGTDTLDLIKANIGLRKRNDDEGQMIAVNEIQARHLKEEIASLNQSLLDLKTEKDTLEERISNLRDKGETLEGRVRDLNAQVRDKETLLEENTKLRADLEAAKQETAQVKGWLNNVEVETITRIPGIDVVRKSITNLKGVSKSLEHETRLGSVGSNSVQSRKHGKS